MENNEMYPPMGNYGGGNDSLWLFYLLLSGGGGGFGPYGGRGGYGSGMGPGGYGAGGGAGPYTDYSLFRDWSNTVDKDNFAQAQQGNHAAINNLSREINQSFAATQKAMCDMQGALQNSHGDIRAAIDACCCKTQSTMLSGFASVEKEVISGNASLDKTLCQNRFDMQMGLQDLSARTQAGFCDVQKSIGDQTHVLSEKITAGDQRVVDTVNRHNEAEFQDKLIEARSARNNCEQTQNLTRIIQEAVQCGCSNSNGNGHGHRST